MGYTVRIYTAILQVYTGIKKCFSPGCSVKQVPGHSTPRVRLPGSLSDMQTPCSNPKHLPESRPQWTKWHLVLSSFPKEEQVTSAINIRSGVALGSTKHYVLHAPEHTVKAAPLLQAHLHGTFRHLKNLQCNPRSAQVQTYVPYSPGDVAKVQ